MEHDPEPADGVGADAAGVYRAVRPAVLALQDADDLGGTTEGVAGGDAAKLPPDRNGPEAEKSADVQRQPVMSSTTPWPGHIVLHADVEVIPVAIEDSAGPLGVEIVQRSDPHTAVRQRVGIVTVRRARPQIVVAAEVRPVAVFVDDEMSRPGSNTRLSIIAKSHVPTTKSCNSGTACLRSAPHRAVSQQTVSPQL